MASLCQSAKADVGLAHSAETLLHIHLIQRNKSASDIDAALESIREKTRENREKTRKKDRFEKRERHRLVLLDCLRRGRKMGVISSTDVSEVENCCKASEIWIPFDCLPCVEERRVEVNPDYCSFPLCPHSQHKRAARIHAVIWPIVKKALRQGKPVKFLTLTGPNFDSLDGGGLHEAVRKAFAKLRHRKAFKVLCDGGGYSLETTNKGCGWHVHLHVLATCGWWDQSDLSRQWFSCLPREWQEKVNRAQPKTHQGRVVVYIQQGDEKAVREFCKYLAKGSGFDDDPEAVAEYVEATKGKRLFESFGTWRRKVREGRKLRSAEARDSHLCPHGYPLERVGLRLQSLEETMQGFAYVDALTFSHYAGIHARRRRGRDPPSMSRVLGDWK